MKAIVFRTAVNSLIWVACGLLVILIRAFILPGSNVLLWEGLGGVMIVYGAARLALVVARAGPSRAVES
jgi:hypothetical protein